MPLHTEVMAVLTTDKAGITNWKQLDDAKFTLANMRGNWSVDYLKGQLPNAKVNLVDTIADTVRLVAQGRADAIVENIDFFMAPHQELPGREVEGAAGPDRRRLLTRSALQLGQLPAARHAQHRPLRPALRATSSTRPGRSGTARRCW